METKLRRHGILFEHVSVNPTLQAGLNTSALFDDKNRYIGTQPIGITRTGLFPQELRTDARVRKFSGFFEFSISTF